MKIKDLPDSSKPRERFLQYGKEALSDAELMAIILRTGSKNKIIEKTFSSLLSFFRLI